MSAETMELQDELEPAWRAVAIKIGLKKALWAIDEGMEPDEALDWFSDCII